MITATRMKLHVIAVYVTVEGPTVTQQQAAQVVGDRLAGFAGLVDGQDIEVSFRIPSNPEVIGDTEALEDPIMVFEEVPISIEDISNIVVTAMEGSYAGTPSWAMSENGDSYRPSRWLDDGYGDVLDDVIVPGFEFVTLWDRETGEPFEDWDGKVTPELVRRGLSIWAQHPHYGESYMAGQHDSISLRDMLDNMDAIDADAVIQYGAFGELTYS